MLPSQNVPLFDVIKPAGFGTDEMTPDPGTFSESVRTTGLSRLLVRRKLRDIKACIQCTGVKSRAHTALVLVQPTGTVSSTAPP